MQKKQYILTHAKQQRLSDEYMQNMIRFERHCDVENLVLFIVAYNNIIKELQQHMTKFNHRTEIDDFVRNLEKIANHYEFKTNTSKNAEKKAYQREVRNTERKLLEVSQQQQYQRFQYTQSQTN